MGDEARDVPGAGEQLDLFGAPPGRAGSPGITPEFDQGNLEPPQQIYVHFRNEEDRRAFSGRIGHPITSLTTTVNFSRGAAATGSAYPAPLGPRDAGEQLALFEAPEKWEECWGGMPEFDQRDLTSYQEILVLLSGDVDRRRFAEIADQPISVRTRSIWFPRAEVGRFADKRYATEAGIVPRYPVYVPTKGRYDSLLTIRALEEIGVPFMAVVEAQEFDAYAAVVDPAQLLVLPHRDKGLVVTRNWIWDHALASGTPRFWTIDDNIRGFFRLNRNLKVPVSSGAIFCAIEDFVERYENVPIAGMNYFMFASRKERFPPITLNTRVYSNMLIQTDVRDRRGNYYRNEGFFNDDTDLCLRVLKDGWCTVLFNAFLILKSTTMTVKGGLTPYYQGDGRWRMAKELRDKHPDVVQITRKWGRWQHQVDYRPFRRNELRLRPGAVVPDGVEDYGMTLEVDRGPGDPAPRGEGDGG